MLFVLRSSCRLNDTDALIYSALEACQLRELVPSYSCGLPVVYRQP